MSSAEPLQAAVMDRGTNDPRRYDLELASRAPAPALRGYVQGFEGYVERSEAPLARREFPGPRVVVILELGPPIAVGAAERPLRGADGQGSFVVGVRSGALLTAHHGYQKGLQINLTPMGACALFGLPLHEIGERIVPLTSVLDGGGALVERLGERRTWDARFDLLEAWLGERVRRPSGHEPVAWALQAIARRGGATSVGALADELGYSRKHLIEQFRRRVGVCPKLWCRLTRFEDLVRRLERGRCEKWSALAAELGFSDQAHLAREVRHFAGLTPTELRAELGRRPAVSPRMAEASPFGAR